MLDDRPQPDPESSTPAVPRGVEPAIQGAGAPAVLGLDNVPLELPIASVGSRGLAAAIDYLLLLMLLILWAAGASAGAGAVGLPGGWTIAIVAIGSFALQWGYFAVLEIAMDGQTPGKAAAGVRVVSRRGGRPSTAAYVIRSILRAFDLLVGVPLMVLDRKARRLGDFAAGTLVVHRRRARTGEAHLGRHPPEWGAREVAVVESFLRRARLMENERAQRLAGRLLEWLEDSFPAFWAEAGEEPGDASAGGDPPLSDDRVAALERLLEAR